MRGNHIQRRSVGYLKGSIPACAGKPSFAISSIGDLGVYPRVCGETAFVQPAQQCPHGLSPRVRGNLPIGVQVRLSIRSIPACAGKPTLESCPVTFSAIYPRVCGETTINGLATFNYAGLSPRVRGNRIDAMTSLTDVGSIPACAGKPHLPRQSSPGESVYPRVCGETG